MTAREKQQEPSSGPAISSGGENEKAQAVFG